MSKKGENTSGVTGMDRNTKKKACTVDRGNNCQKEKEKISKRDACCYWVSNYRSWVEIGMRDMGAQG